MPCPVPLQEREQMQRYNQRMVEQLKVRQQQEKARLPKIQRSEGKTRMAMYKKSLHIHSSGSASEQREKIKQVRPCKGHQGCGLAWGYSYFSEEGKLERSHHSQISNPLQGDRGLCFCE